MFDVGVSTILVNHLNFVTVICLCILPGTFISSFRNALFLHACHHFADVRLSNKQEMKLVRSKDPGGVTCCKLLFRTNTVCWCRKHSLLVQCVSRHVYRPATCTSILTPNHISYAIFQSPLETSAASISLAMSPTPVCRVDRGRRYATRHPLLSLQQDQRKNLSADRKSSFSVAYGLCAHGPFRCFDD